MFVLVTMAEGVMASFVWLKSLENKNECKDRPTQTPHVAFVVASHYCLQIIYSFFCSHKHVFKGCSFFVREDWRLL